MQRAGADRRQLDVHGADHPVRTALALSPAAGPAAGGQSVTVTGLGSATVAPSFGVEITGAGGPTGTPGRYW